MSFSPDQVASMTTGLFGLVGAVVGAAVSWFATSQAEEKRWKREEARRFDAQRREAYARFLYETTKLSPMKYERGANIWQSHGDWLLALSNVEVVASKEVHLAAHNFASAASEIKVAQETQDTKPLPNFAKYRQELIDAIRQELGLQPSFFAIPEKPDA